MAMKIKVLVACSKITGTGWVVKDLAPPEDDNPGIDEDINNVSEATNDLGLGDPPGHGLWVWEGLSRLVEVRHPDCWGEYDVEYKGEWRRPTPDELAGYDTVEPSDPKEGWAFPPEDSPFDGTLMPSSDVEGAVDDRDIQMYVAGIDQPSHGHVIEVYGPDAETAEARRDWVLNVLKGQVVPPGWSVVPPEPTGAMIDAACKAMSPDHRPTADYVSVREKHTIRYRAMLAAAPTPDGTDSAAGAFQDRVQPWLTACFGETIATDVYERGCRFLEEAIELVQALGLSKDDALALVDYVYGREIGHPPQEVGGVMVTLAALCLAHKMDMHRLGEAELARVWLKIDQIRQKQANKPIKGPLPGTVA